MFSDPIEVEGVQNQPDESGESEEKEETATNENPPPDNAQASDEVPDSNSTQAGGANNEETEKKQDSSPEESPQADESKDGGGEEKESGSGEDNGDDTKQNDNGDKPPGNNANPETEQPSKLETESRNPFDEIKQAEKNEKNSISPPPGLQASVTRTVTPVVSPSEHMESEGREESPFESGTGTDGDAPFILTPPLQTSTPTCSTESPKHDHNNNAVSATTEAKSSISTDNNVDADNNLTENQSRNSSAAGMRATSPDSTERNENDPEAARMQSPERTVPLREEIQQDDQKQSRNEGESKNNSSRCSSSSSTAGKGNGRHDVINEDKIPKTGKDEIAAECTTTATIATPKERRKGLYG